MEFWFCTSWLCFVQLYDTNPLLIYNIFAGGPKKIVSEFIVGWNGLISLQSQMLGTNTFTMMPIVVRKQNAIGARVHGAKALV